jgi:hypothetical protein
MRALPALAVAVLPAVAQACAVCGAGEDDPARGAYVTMTLIISALPLGMLGGLIGYVAWKAKAAAREEQAAQGKATPAP